MRELAKTFFGLNNRREVGVGRDGHGPIRGLFHRHKQQSVVLLSCCLHFRSGRARASARARGRGREGPAGPVRTTASSPPYALPHFLLPSKGSPSPPVLRVYVCMCVCVSRREREREGKGEGKERERGGGHGSRSKRLAGCRLKPTRSALGQPKASGSLRKHPLQRWEEEHKGDPHSFSCNTQAALALQAQPSNPPAQPNQGVRFFYLEVDS